MIASISCAMRRFLSVFAKETPILPTADAEQLVTAEEREATTLAVTRHGLQESGVRCPRCGSQAVEPGDWTQIHKRQRILRDGKGVELDRWLEEGVSCTACGTFLLASPDDDIDPVVAGEPYDESIYHTFVRPEGWEPPTQRRLARAPREQEWIVVEPGTSVEVAGAQRDVSNAEGRVVEVDGDRARVELAGFCGVKKDTFVWFDLDQIRPMVFDRLQIGTRVRLMRHSRYQGREGEISKLPSSEEEAGTVGVTLDGDDIEVIVPIERVKQILEEQ